MPIAWTLVFANDAPAAAKEIVNCLVSREIVTAYWLIPTEPAHSYFQSVINDLARQYNAPPFEPHLTVHVEANCTNAVGGALLKAAQGCQRIVLQAIDVSSSPEFIKTLFVQFAVTTQLQQLNHRLRAAAKGSFDYELNPHLSLLYKTMASEPRRLLARSIEVPFSEVTFGSLKAVRCISPTQSRADVEAWSVVAEKSLGSIGV